MVRLLPRVRDRDDLQASTWKSLERVEVDKRLLWEVLPADHPDPKEVNLQLLAKVMKIKLEYWKQRGIGTFAVFFE